MKRRRNMAHPTPGPWAVEGDRVGAIIFVAIIGFILMLPVWVP